MCFDILTGLIRYTKDRQKLFQRLRYAPLRIPPTMSIECASLVSAFLCRNPMERLGAQGTKAIKDHPFFRPDMPRVHGGDTRDGAAESNPNPKTAPFNWKDLESRSLKPPIDPMEGIPMSAEDRDNTANFDPQFTKLEVETDNEEEVRASSYFYLTCILLCYSFCFRCF